MPRAQLHTKVFDSVNGGLNVRDPQNRLKDNEATVALNCFFDNSGALYKRGGWSKMISSAVGTAGNLIGVGQGSWIIAGVITRFVLATDGIKVFRLNGAAWTDITGALVLLANAETIVTYIQFNNLLISVDGKNSPYTWNGVDATISALGGTPPIGNMAIVFQNRVWWAGVATAQTRLYYSDIGTPSVYGASSYFDIPSQYDGEPITGLAVLYGKLIIFKRYSIYVLDGDDPTTMVLSKLNSSVGCVSPYSVIAVNNLIYFVSDKGLYAMNLFNNRQVCYRVEPRYTSAVINQLQGGTLSRNRIQALHYRRRSQIWMAMDSTAAGQDHHDRILVHDYSNATQEGDPIVSEYTKGGTEAAPAVMADYVDPTTGVITAMASFYDKFVYTYSEAGTSDAAPTGSATAIDMQYETGYRDFGDGSSMKTIRWVYSSGSFSGGVPTFKMVKSNDIGVSSTTISFTPAVTSDFYNQRASVPFNASFGQAMAKYFKFGFRSNDGGAFTLYEYSFDLLWKGRRA